MVFHNLMLGETYFEVVITKIFHLTKNSRHGFSAADKKTQTIVSYKTTLVIYFYIKPRLMSKTIWGKSAFVHNELHLLGSFVLLIDYMEP